MNRVLKIKMLLQIVLVLLIVAASVPLFAQEENEVRIQLDQEAAVPGHLLSPGSYLLRRESFNNQNVYEMIRAANDQFIGYFEVVPTTRIANQYSEVDLSAPDAAGVRTVQAWYGPDSATGHEFIYSKRQERKLDQLAKKQAAVNGSSAG